MALPVCSRSAARSLRLNAVARRPTSIAALNRVSHRQPVRLFSAALSRRAPETPITDKAAAKAQEAQRQASERAQEAKHEASEKAQEAHQVATDKAQAARQTIAQTAEDAQRTASVNAHQAKDQAFDNSHRTQQTVTENADDAQRIASVNARHAADQASDKAQAAQQTITQNAEDAQRTASVNIHQAKDQASDKAQRAQQEASAKAQSVQQSASSAAQEAKQAASAKAQEAKAKVEKAASQANEASKEANRVLPPSVTTKSAFDNPSKASSRSSSSSSPFGFVGKIVSYTLFAFGGTFLFTYYLDSRSAIHRWVAMPFLHSFVDAEDGQKLAIELLKSGIAPRDYTGEDDTLETELFGQPLVNPIGLAAGFDKQGEAIDGLFNLGFGLVEIGSVTPEPQPGNPKPRYFRLPSHSASINRFGFNSDGHAVVLERLLDRVRDHIYANPELIPPEYLPDPRSPDVDPRMSHHDALQKAALVLTRDAASVADLLDHHGLPRSLRPGRLLSINLGKNKTSAEDDPSDYVKGVETFGLLADMLVINVSSPNTPGLRDLQKKEALEKLLKSVSDARDALPTRGQKNQEKRVPLVVKISPDLSKQELEDVSSVIIKSGIDGVIISNTTVQRPASLVESVPEADFSTLRETGGLSGPPLREISRAALKEVAGKLRGAGVEVIAAGGISTPEDVLQASKDGAHAIQVYTAFGWQGVGMISRWKEELRALLKGQDKETNTWKFLAHQTTSSLALAEQERQQRAKPAGDALQRGALEIRQGLQQLRQTLGGGDSSGGSSGVEDASSVYFPAEDDETYNDLLTSARRALGLSEPQRGLTLGQELQADSEALSAINPLDSTSVPPTQVISASGGTSSPAEAKGREEEKTVIVVGSDDEISLTDAQRGDVGGKGKDVTRDIKEAVQDWKEWANIDKARKV